MRKIKIEIENLAVDTDLVVACMAVFILLGAVEGPLLAWGLALAASATADLARPDRLLAFTSKAAAIIVPLAAVNAALGALAGYRLSVPLARLRKALQEVARGNLEHEMGDEAGEMLASYTDECRKTLESLRRLIYRDRDFAKEASACLEKCLDLLEGMQPSEKKQKLDELLNHARSRLCIVNEHFTKGQGLP